MAFAPSPESASAQQAVDSGPGSAQTAAGRNAALDGLKFVAAALIVLIHVANVARIPYPSKTLPSVLVNLGYWALFFFIMVSGYLHGSLGIRGAAWLKKRSVRLGIPYLAWSLLYLLYHEAIQLLLHRPLVAVNAFEFLFFAGAEGVLWSLAMLLYCAVVVELVVHTARARRMAILLAACAALAVYSFPAATAGAEPLYWVLSPQWLLVYLLGMELRASTPEPSRGLTYRLLFCGAIGGLTAMTWAPGFIDARLAASMVAMLDIVAAWALLSCTTLQGDVFSAARLAKGGEYLLGVYVSHYLFVEVWAIVMRKISGIPVGLWIAFGWVACFSLAWLTTHLLMHARLLRQAVV